VVPFRCPRSTTAPDARKSCTGKAQLGLPEQGLLCCSALSFCPVRLTRRDGASLPTTHYCCCYYPTYTHQHREGDPKSVARTACDWAQGKPKGDAAGAKGGKGAKPPKDLKQKFKAKFKDAVVETIRDKGMAAGEGGADGAHPAAAVTATGWVCTARIARVLTRVDARVAGVKTGGAWDVGDKADSAADGGDAKAGASGKNMGKRRRLAAKRQAKRVEKGLPLHERKVKADGGDDQGGGGESNAEKKAAKAKKKRAEGDGKGEVRERGWWFSAEAGQLPHPVHCAASQAEAETTTKPAPAALQASKSISKATKGFVLTTLCELGFRTRSVCEPGRSILHCAATPGAEGCRKLCGGRGGAGQIEGAAQRRPLPPAQRVAVHHVVRSHCHLGLGFRLPAPVESSRAWPPLRPREDGLPHPAATSRTDLAAAFGLLSRWRLAKPLVFSIR
jgi:hypothetical protein